jgi:hypothetical protein
MLFAAAVGDGVKGTRQGHPHQGGGNYEGERRDLGTPECVTEPPPPIVGGVDAEYGYTGWEVDFLLPDLKKVHQ